MLEKTKKIDKIEIITETGILQIREKTVITDDGEEISSSYHRYCLNPLSDISEQDQEIQNIAGVLWTQEKKDAYQKLIDSANNDIQNN